MRLTRLTIFLIAATFLAVEPVVHSHPLLPDGSRGASGISNPNLCAICAIGADRVVLETTAVVAPTFVVERLATTPSQPTVVEAAVSVASRAPPAA